MQEEYDICVIGGGILGCMSARELSRYQLRTALFEKKEDICCGITKANSAIVYAGYDHKPGTRKRQMCIRGNARMDQLCEELQVELKRCGSIMVAFGPKGEAVLREKYKQGQIKQVPGLRLLSGSEVLEMEKEINPKVTMGLFAPTTATVNPWELGIAACENAVQNDCSVFMHTEVTDIQKEDRGIKLVIYDRKNDEQREIWTKGVLNCGGLESDSIREMLLPPSVRIHPGKACYLVFSQYLKQMPEHIIFHEPESDEKGITLIPTTDGSLLVGATEEKAATKTDLATTGEGLTYLKEKLANLIPELDFSEMVSNFAALRPNPFLAEDEAHSIRGFVIDQADSCPEMVSLIGIKTPGLTCSLELAEYALEKLFSGLGIQPAHREDFQPVRQKRTTSEEAAKNICYCMQVSEQEIRDVVRNGADTLEAVKHRCRTGMGRCQGSRCSSRIQKIISDEEHVKE